MKYYSKEEKIKCWKKRLWDRDLSMNKRLFAESRLKVLYENYKRHPNLELSKK